MNAPISADNSLILSDTNRLMLEALAWLFNWRER